MNDILLSFVKDDALKMERKTVVKEK